MNIKKTVFAAIFTCINLAITAVPYTEPKVYLDNAYSKKVIYNLNGTEGSIEPNSRKLLGTLNSIMSLRIKTALSMYKDISNLITKLKPLSKSRPDRKTIIIFIEDTTTALQWKLGLNWDI